MLRLENFKIPFGMAILFCVFFLVSCKSKQIADDPIKKYLSMENPYAERNKEKPYGFAEANSALRDSIIMCYELLDQNDQELKPIIHHLVTNNPENEELRFIKAMNHMNQENYGKAIEGFSALRFSEDYVIMDQSRYYYALISLYLNNKDRDALSVFNDISRDIKSEFQYHAKDLLAYL